MVNIIVSSSLSSQERAVHFKTSFYVQVIDWWFLPIKQNEFDFNSVKSRSLAATSHHVCTLLLVIRVVFRCHRTVKCSVVTVPCMLKTVRGLERRCFKKIHKYTYQCHLLSLLMSLLLLLLLLCYHHHRRYFYNYCYYY